MFDLSGTHGTIPPPATQSPFCSVGLFPCDNGNCYNSNQKCDFLDACGDSTDERVCGMHMKYFINFLCNALLSSGILMNCKLTDHT